jgi:hypothetical protein
MWTTAAALHMEDNAETWMHVYKQKYGLGSWKHFINAVQAKFGAYDHQHAIDDLLELQQLDSVEDYVTAFEALQFQLTMHNQDMGEKYFVSQFIKGLKPEIRYHVQGQVPENMERAVKLAKIQQTIQDKTKVKFGKAHTSYRQPPFAAAVKSEAKNQFGNSQLTKERLLRDYCRLNNLCFYCKEPYDPNHAVKCSKRPKAQANALVLNDLDIQLTNEVLAQLDMEDTLNAEFGSLSLNALAGSEKGEAPRLRALVKNKVMLILVDSGSSHSFVSSSFLVAVGIIPVSAKPKQVRVANGDILISDKIVPQMEWWVQGHSFCTDMSVLDLQAYDAILGFDWLKTHSPINHHWEHKTMECIKEKVSLFMEFNKMHCNWRECLWTEW